MDKLIMTDLALHGVSVIIGYLTYKFVRQGLWWVASTRSLVAKTQDILEDPQEESDSPVSSSEIVQS
jgi:hypothetical protein